MPVPDARPSEKIARLFPQIDPAVVPSKDQKDTVNPSAAASNSKPIAGTVQPSDHGPTAPPPSTVAQASSAATGAKAAVPLPEPRPNIEPLPEWRNPRHVRPHYLRR